MNILTSLDIALGMIVVYLVFALGVTAFNEALAAYFSSRAKWLRLGIRALLAPPAAGGGAGRAPARVPDPAQGFYDSPFIRHLAAKSGFQPSYIPPWTLLQGLLDSATAGKGAVLATLAQIEAAAQRLPEGQPLRTAVLDLLARADGDLAAFRQGVEAWAQGFDDQVRAWYRQKTQYVLVALSLATAGLMNLDTIALVRHLATDSKTREALAQMALEDRRQAQLKTLVSQPELQAAQAQASAVQGQADATPAQRAEAASAVAAAQARHDQALQAQVDNLAAAGLPLGWSQAEVARMGVLAWLVKLLGLLLSAAALSMGAPFWFDLLQKIAAVRSVGLNPIEKAARAATTPPAGGG
jgi:hypothetical protein